MGRGKKEKVGDSTSTKTSNNIFTLGFRIIHEFQKSFFDEWQQTLVKIAL